MQCLPIIRIFPVKITKRNGFVDVDAGFVLERIQCHTVSFDKIFTIVHLNYLGNCSAARLGTDVSDEVVKHGDEWIVRSCGDGFVEFHVLVEYAVDVVVVAAKLIIILSVEAFEFFSVLVAEAALTNELGYTYVDDLAKVEDIFVRTAAGENSLVKKRIEDIWGRVVADEGTFGTAYFDDAVGDEGAYSLTDSVAADAKSTHELDFGGQFVAGLQLTRDDGVRNAVDDGLHKRLILYGGRQMFFVQE